jgi:hypothetical protein
MTTTGLLLFIALRLVIALVYEKESLLSFYTLAIILIYSLKLGIDCFFLTNYNRRNCLILALGLNVFFYLLAVVFGNM